MTLCTGGCPDGRDVVSLSFRYHVLTICFTMWVNAGISMVEGL